MGYSCTVLAGESEKAIVKILKAKHGEAGNCTNAWGDIAHDRCGAIPDAAFWFHDTGDEQADGSVVGIIHKVSGGASCRVGTYKIDHQGVILHWPGTTKAMRDIAVCDSMIHHIRVYGSPKGIADDHPAHHLASAMFVVV